MLFRSPSLFTALPLPGEVKDLTQVRVTAEHFARLDDAGKLGALFAPAKDLAAETIDTAASEEGWILGS